MKTPVAFLIFNRPLSTLKVFESIARAKPERLYIVADGPREHVEGEAEACLKARAVLDRVDWTCEVFTNFSDVNMGCRRRVSSGLSWVFEQSETAIVLEDDCLPDASFFPYCEELLNRYLSDDRIMAISGDSLARKGVPASESYYFSRYFHCWGWATWRRAWQLYDFDPSRWTEFRAGDQLIQLLQDKAAAEYWTENFDAMFAGKVNSWAYQFLLATWLNNGYSIAPSLNLVSNIGFGADATHTSIADPNVANVAAREMRFPMVHPPEVVWNKGADLFEHRFVFRCHDGRTWLSRNRNRVRSRLGPLLRLYNGSSNRG